MPKKKRDYTKEYKDFHGTKEQKDRRAARGRARYAAEKAGKVKKGDKSKEVHHKNAPRKGKLNNKNTAVISKKANRKMQPKRGKKGRKK